MSQELIRVSRSFTAIYRIRTFNSEKERWRKHIAEISKHLATEPIQSDELTYEQEEWINFRMSRPFPKPYRPHKPIEIPYKWIEVEDTKT